MRTYAELLELAFICATNAHLAKTKGAALELWKLANKYRAKALALDSGKPINLGPAPLRLGK
jgi:hypothetical protein